MCKANVIAVLKYDIVSYEKITFSFCRKIGTQHFDMTECHILVLPLYYLIVSTVKDQLPPLLMYLFYNL